MPIVTQKRVSVSKQSPLSNYQYVPLATRLRYTVGPPSVGRLVNLAWYSWSDGKQIASRQACRRPSRWPSRHECQQQQQRQQQQRHRNLTASRRQLKISEPHYQTVVKTERRLSRPFQKGPSSIHPNRDSRYNRHVCYAGIMSMTR